MKIVLILTSLNIYAQSSVKLILPLPLVKVKGSYYNKISVFDARVNQLNEGTVQTGMFDKTTIVIAKPTLQVQLRDVFDALLDSSAKPAELLLQLRLCNFTEIKGSIPETGLFFFRAKLYSSGDGKFKEVNSIDTILTIKSSIDVTDGLLNAGKAIINKFISNSLLIKPQTISYTMNDVLKIDSIEKQRLKLYSTVDYEDGVYLTYDTFKNQLPDKKIIVNDDASNQRIPKAIDKEGNVTNINPKNVYAIVYKRRPFISSKGIFYPIQKEHGNLYFTGRLVSESNSNLGFSAVLFGLIGSLFTGDNDIYLVKIDHLNGLFFKLKKIPAVNTNETIGE